MKSKAKPLRAAVPDLRGITFPYRITGGKSRFTDKQIQEAWMPIFVKLGRAVKK